MALKIAVAILAVFRLSLLFVYEKSMNGFRQDVVKMWVKDADGNPKTFFGKIFDCFWCTTSLFAVLAATCILVPYGWYLLLVPAVSGAAILLLHFSNMLRYLEK